MNRFLLALPLILLVYVVPSVFAEERTYTIPENSIQAFEILLERGEKIEFTIAVQEEKEINFFVEDPNGERTNYGEATGFDSTVLSESSGLYTFVFDNSMSLTETKELDFDFTVTKVKYLVYFDAMPDSDIDLEQVFFDVIEFWKTDYPDLEYQVVDSPQEANLNVQFVKDFGTEHVGYALGAAYMEVGLGDDGCRGNWQPYSEEHVLHIMKHEFGHILGLDHTEDPDDIMFSVSQGREYGTVDEEFIFSENYAHFIPICSQKQITAIDFEIKSEDDTHGFDVFVLPSIDEFRTWQSGDDFRYYFHGDCFASDFLRFAGECHGLTNGSGLMITTDDQSSSLTKINVKIKEKISDIDYPQKTSLFPRDKSNSISKSTEANEIKQLQKEIVELKRENKQLKNKIDAMTNEFALMIKQLNEWFRDQLNS